MTVFEVRYAEKETTRNGDGPDGIIDDFRTFEQGPPSYWIDGVEVDEESFLARIEDLPELPV